MRALGSLQDAREICCHVDPDAALGDRHLERAVNQALASLEAEPDAAAVFDRATTAFMRELLGLRGALRAVGRDRQLLAQDDETLLAGLLIQALRADPLVPKAMHLRLQGELALRRLPDASGGAFTASEVAKLLGITPDAVRKRAARGKLLALPQGERTLYSAFQFDAEGHRLVPGLAGILPLLDTESAPAKLRFFLTPDADLGGTPIDTLRGGYSARRALLERKARQFGMQLAA